jgi:hypothetical protein
MVPAPIVEFFIPLSIFMLAISGKIVKFNDDILNNNITLSLIDSTGINNQNLINDLPNGLYKIEKNYDDGATKETVMYRGNN